MSAISFERQFVKAGPSPRPARRVGTREEEFRAALDSYMARYVAEQTKRRLAVGGTDARDPLIRRRHLRRLLTAIRQLWISPSEAAGTDGAQAGARK